MIETPRSHFHPALVTRPKELCQIVGVYRGTLPDGDWLASDKIDGWRCLSFTGQDGSKRRWSRNGIPIEGTGHIRHRLDAMEAVAGVPLMFDGEFQVGGTLAATKAWCESGWKAGGEAGTLHLFDMQTQIEWEAGGSTRPLFERLADLDRLHAAVEASPLPWEWREGTRGKEPPHPHVTILSAEYVGNHADVKDMANRIWSRGGEGLVLKRADSPYQRNLNNDWMKVKQR